MLLGIYLTRCTNFSYIIAEFVAVVSTLAVKAADDTIHSTDVNATDPVDSPIANLQTGISSGDGNENDGAIKVALVDSGAPANSGNVYRYGVILGTVKEDTPAGTWINEESLNLPTVRTGAKNLALMQ